MSVYTRLTKEELEELLNHYDIGEFVSIEGINEGITNSNFYLKTSNSKYILTIFEEPNLNLDYAISLMSLLSKNHIPCPSPIKTKNKKTVLSIQNKPLSIFTLLPGNTISKKVPTKKMCEEIGETIGKIHICSKNFEKFDPGLRDGNWFEETAKKVGQFLDQNDIKLIDKEILNQKECCNQNLPRGVIHSDLFRDNAMFLNNKLTGVIDFYYACNGYFLYDLAIIANDWCITHEKKINIEMQNALINSYAKIRPIEDIEKKLWQKALRHAALRFWLSRLHDKFFPISGEITHQLDPDEFKSILLDRINNNYTLNINE